MITVEQLARELNLAPFTVRKYARLNLIPAIKVGRDWRFQSLEEVVSTLAVTKGNKTAKSAAMAMRRAA
jgi:excisionase family DNA binding protein